MKSIAFANYTDFHITAFGLILFVAVFVGVIIWTGLKPIRKQHEASKNLPFNDGEENV